MATTDGAPSTLYPKITSHISEVVDTLLTLHGGPQPSASSSSASIAPIPLVGTVKLHGTHADVLISPDNSIVFQSRNTVGLTPAKDNQGFAAALSQNSRVLLTLRDACLARWAQLHPNHVDACSPRAPVILAGEWIGTKIQKDVAVSLLSRRFVIVSISIDREWQKDEDYADIEDAEHGVYNVLRAGVYRATLYPDDVQRTVEETQLLAEQVAAKCPFAGLFGVQGLGEGIVWKMASSSESMLEVAGCNVNANPALWFKTKGGMFKPTFYQPQGKTVQDGEAGEQSRREAETAAKAWCGTLRLEQAWDVLGEKGIKRDAQGLGAFLTWLQQDIIGEEKKGICSASIQESVLKKEIAKIARPWYRAKVREKNDM
jgi:hypothetical protein